MRKTPDAQPAQKFGDRYFPALLNRAAHLIAGEFHRMAIANGFTISEWRILAGLAEGVPCSIGELSVATLLKQPTVTRVVRRMESRGQVSRVTHPTDGRITLVQITAAGARVLEALMALALEHERRVLEPFGERRSQELKQMLAKLIELHSASGLAPMPDVEE